MLSAARDRVSSDTAWVKDRTEDLARADATLENAFAALAT
jgi:hypothetical protein